ncbi:hypothetical protein Tco_0976132 [Tanacetum coccineum]|uniref:Uncharacterized protein n=1 Tax=Tanacetum coccineum TaxID=301880 RepID=A0ABQ5EGD6_9ASTR
MVKKGKNFSGKVTPLFDSMLLKQTEDEGDASERPSDSPPIPSPPHLSEDQPHIQPDPSPKPLPTTYIFDSIPEGSGGNHGGQSSNDASLSGNKDGLTLQSVKKLKKGVKPLITHHKAWMKTRLARKTSLRKKGVHKEYVSKQGRKYVKTFKGEPSVHKDLAFDDLDDFVDVDDTLDYIETMDVQDEKRNKGTDKGNKGTDKQDRAPTPTPIVFGDDETIAQVLIIMSQNKEKLKEKEKGVEIRNVEETKRPMPTLTRSILTLIPLPKIDPKDKGKKRIEEEDESDTESEGITEAEKKFKQLVNDEEVAKKVQKEWEAEEEKKMLVEEEATKAALTNEYADKILAEELQNEEREKFTIKQRAKFLHDTIAAQRKFLAQQRLKRQDQNFVAIGFAEDERQIKEMNEESKDPEKKGLKKRVVNEEDTAKVHVKQEATEQGTKKRKSGHVKMIARKRPRPQPDDDSDDEHRKCLRITTFESTIDSEIMETKSFIARLHKVSSPDRNYLVIYRVNGYFRAFNYLMEVLHIFDRHDLFHLYDLVMKQYSEITPKDIELILWGDLKIMIKSLTEENNQELEVEEESTAALQLGSQLTLLHSKELASPGSNSSWLSIHLVVYNEELAIPEQTATGKGISNPLMADDHKDKECSQEVLGYNPQKLNQKKLEVNK